MTTEPEATKLLARLNRSRRTRRSVLDQLRELREKQAQIEATPSTEFSNKNAALNANAADIGVVLTRLEEMRVETGFLAKKIRQHFPELLSEPEAREIINEFETTYTEPEPSAA